MTRPSKRPLLLAALCSVVLVVSLASMIQRLVEHNKAKPREQHVFQPVNERAFRYADRDVSIQDVGEAGREGVELKYADATERLTAAIPPMESQLPGLLRHQDWLRVLRLVTLRGPGESLTQKLDAGEDRLIVVTRRPLLGPDPRSGSYAKKEWAFDFLELRADGSIAKETWKYPHNRAGRDRKPDELPAGSWQENAAIMLMPTFQAPNSSFAYGAVKAMGWTLPAAGLSGVTLILAFAWWLASGLNWQGSRVPRVA